MTKVFCPLSDCEYNQKYDECKKDAIQLNEKEDVILCDENVCLNYSSIFNKKEYTNNYYETIVFGKERTPFRRLKRGKKIYAGGMVFFTDMDYRYPEECRITEEKSGLSVGKLRNLERKDFIAHIKLNLDKHYKSGGVPVMELPEFEPKNDAS